MGDVTVLVLVPKLLSSLNYVRLQKYIRKNIGDKELLTFRIAYRANNRTYLMVVCHGSVYDDLKTAIDNAPLVPGELWQDVHLQCNLIEKERYFNAFVDSSASDEVTVRDKLQKQNPKIKANIPLWVFIQTFLRDNCFRHIFSVPESDNGLLVICGKNTFVLNPLKDSGLSSTTHRREQATDKFSKEIQPRRAHSGSVEILNKSPDLKTTRKRSLSPVAGTSSSTFAAPDQQRKRSRKDDNKSSLRDGISQILKILEDIQKCL